jgi:hypothetical protein
LGELREDDQVSILIPQLGEENLQILIKVSLAPLCYALISLPRSADAVVFMSPITNLRTELAFDIQFNLTGDEFESRGRNPSLIHFS